MGFLMPIPAAGWVFLFKRRKTMKNHVHKLFLAVLLAGSVPLTYAEESPAELSLEQRLNLLERKQEIADEEAAAKAKTAGKATASPGEGFSLQNVDKSFLIKFSALVQADGRFFTDDVAGVQTDQFLLRRVRPTLSGTLYRDFDFRITPDFANNSATSLFDAYLDIKTVPAAKLRVGKFKPPVGLERLQSGGDLSFVERGFPTSLVPSRDTGVQLFGDVLGGKVSYAASFTNGVADGGVGETDTNDGKEGAARIFLTPFKDNPGLFQGLGFGFSGTFADSGQTLTNYRTPGQLQAFTWAAAATADGERTRISPQLYWSWRSIGFLGEFVRSAQVVRSGTRKYHISNDAWQGVLSYVLTREEASFKGVKPAKNFDPKAGGWGAFEIVTRLQRLDLDSEIFDHSLASTTNSIQQATAWSTGLNWYLNRSIKFVVDYEQTEFDRGAARGDRPNEKLVFTRWQVAY